MANVLISLNDVTVRLNENRVLSDITFDILPGECCALIGKSGSGKSLLLKVIAGLQSVNSGSVSYNFADAKTHHPIVLVDSRHQFKNNANTADLYYQQRFNSSDADDAPTVAALLADIAKSASPGCWTIEKVTDSFSLASIFEKELIKLSNGETKRLRLASALLKNPRLLLLDQPLTGLDVDMRRNFDALLKDITDSGITIILATSPMEVPSIINKIMVLAEGKIVNVIKKENFHPQEFKWQEESKHIDESEIVSLINTPVETFSALIKMTGVNVRYGDKQILKNISWEVKQSERWALLGHNGAGKSTLLSLIYGDNPQAYSNNIVLFDKKRGSGESIWDIKQKCGFVSPELFQYFPTDNNCLQVIESGFYDTLGLFRQSEPNRAALASRWMWVLNIDRYAKMPLKNIPASAQRLCLLARALVKNPVLLILDEPCQGLDDVQKAQFKNVIEAICRQSNLTLIYVTHYEEELPGAINKYFKLKNGEETV